MTYPHYFPEAIDNSMRKSLVLCQKKAHWQYEVGLRVINDEKIDLLAGKAFAAGIEAARLAFYRDSESQEIAVSRGTTKIFEVMGNCIVPVISTKSPSRMAGALVYYCEQHPFVDDEYQPLTPTSVEVSFSWEMPIQHPTTNKPLVYCGRFDMLAKDNNGDIWVVDEKTTSKLGDAWGQQWLLDSQMTCYVDGAKHWLKANGYTELVDRVRGAIINGISIKKYDYETVRVIVPRETWEIARWKTQLIQEVSEWIDAWRYQNHHMALDHACAMYNHPCEYAKLCKSANPERLIDGNYVVRFWNPLTREESATK